MKFLATGDLQIHAWKQFSYTRKDGMNSRLYNCLKVFDVLLKEALSREINKILIDGDVIEENSYIDVEVFDATYLKLEKLHDAGMDVTLNLGNHDVSRQSGGRILHTLRAFRKVATIVEEPTLVWKHLWVVPWDSSPARIKEAIRSCNPSKGDKICLVLHCGVQGAKTGPTGYLVRNPIKLSDLHRERFGLVLLSDYHTRQRLSKNPDVWYLGSPLQHSFGEVHRPCIWAVSLDREGLYHTQKLYTSFPRFRRVMAADVSQLQKELSRCNSGDYIRVQIAGSLLQEKTIRRFAERGRFQYQIEYGSEGEDSGQSRGYEGTYDVGKAFKTYVKREEKDLGRRHRLIELGNKLYKGEL
jgi:DNA repair exonuclease SbcCD nuclease subunit